MNKRGMGKALDVVYRENSFEEFCVKRSTEMSWWLMGHGDKQLFYFVSF